jgi:hypothetical protein
MSARSQTDLAAPYISLLEALSHTAGVAFVGAAAPIVGTIKTGMQLLAKKPGQASLEIGHSGDFPAPRTGHYVLIRVPKGTFGRDELQLDADGRLQTANGPIVEHPYVVFSMDATSKRDDWFKIPEIAAAYRDLKEALSRRDNVGAVANFEAFKVACLLSEDLITDDATKLVEATRKKMALVMPATVTGARADATAPNLPPLEELPLYDNQN